MLTEEHESVNFEVFVWWAVNFDFFSHPTQKQGKFDLLL